MADTLSITLAQLNQSVGDIVGNAAAMLAARERARTARADLIVFPEMQLIGYPPEDLVLKPALLERASTLWVLGSRSRVACMISLIVATFAVNPATFTGGAKRR